MYPNSVSGEKQQQLTKIYYSILLYMYVHTIVFCYQINFERWTMLQ